MKKNVVITVSVNMDVAKVIYAIAAILFVLL